MPALRCLVPSLIKGGNGGSRNSWLRSPKWLLLQYLRLVRDAILNKFCPFGYEDETGFHYGKPGE
jgi:hypothetical protein